MNKILLNYFFLIVATVTVNAQDYPFNLPDNLEATVNINSASTETYNNLLLGTNIHHFKTATEKNFIKLFDPITVRFPHGLWSNWYDWRRDVSRLYGEEKFDYKQGTNGNIKNVEVGLLSTIKIFDSANIKVGIDGLTGLNTDKKKETGKGYDLMWTFNMSADGTDFNNGSPESILRYNDLISRGFEVKAIEMGNECFYPGQRSSIIPNSEDYIARAKSMSAALKAQDPEIRVSIPLLRKSSWANPNWNKDLTADLSYFDAVSVHTYVGADPDNAADSDEAYGTSLIARKLLASSINDYAKKVAPNKPIWLTEWGVKSGGPNAVSALGAIDCFLYMSENQDVFERANWFSVNGKLNTMLVWEKYTASNGKIKDRIKYPLEKSLFGSAYEITRSVLENSTLIASDVQVPNLVDGVKAVSVRVVNKDDKTIVFVLNLTNKEVPFTVNIDGVTYDKTYKHKALSFSSMDEERALGFDVDPLTLINEGDEKIMLPKFSINTIELSNTILSNNSYTKKHIIVVSPNPNKGEFKIKTTNAEQSQYRIYSITGVEIQKGQFVSEETIRLKREEKGIYILQIENNNNTSTHKIIVD
ncbi:T9SS type A sorting domain-containing protein [Polaribacter sp. L3A8]|uniref:T9SS type A sorting domain-containing protein n=1 Tax=Polaribacter sp. L3A8 TaxID=2686361 RepID=UPI00131CCCC3|nr:T9SS type A sorting domain-containing protein [Polaribacter sp. L3A8]